MKGILTKVCPTAGGWEYWKVEVSSGETCEVLLLTEGDLEDARNRAKKHPDLCKVSPPPDSSFWGNFKRLFTT